MSQKTQTASKLLPLLIAAFGSLASAQSVEENAAAIAQNREMIQVNYDLISANVAGIETNAATISDNWYSILGNVTAFREEVHDNFSLVDDALTSSRSLIADNTSAVHQVNQIIEYLTDATRANEAGIQTIAARIDANAGGDVPPEAPNASLPYQIPPAFIVDVGFFEVRWICADTVPTDCDIGMLGDGGDIQVLRNFVLPTFVGGREADTTVNSYLMSISATDPESYWLGAPMDGNPPPKHLWLVHSSGWLHVF